MLMSHEIFLQRFTRTLQCSSKKEWLEESKFLRFPSLPQNDGFMCTFWATSFLHRRPSFLSPLQLSFIDSRSSLTVVHHVFSDSVCRPPTPMQFMAVLAGRSTCSIACVQWIPVSCFSQCLTAAATLTVLVLHHWSRGHAEKFPVWCGDTSGWTHPACGECSLCCSKSDMHVLWLWLQWTCEVGAEWFCWLTVLHIFSIGHVSTVSLL